MIYKDMYDKPLSIGDEVVVTTRSYGCANTRKAEIIGFTEDKILFVGKSIRTEWEKNSDGSYREKFIGIVAKKSFTWIRAYGRKNEDSIHVYNVIKI